LCPNKGLAFGPAFALLADLANLDNHGRLTKPLRSGHTPKIKRVSGIDEPGSRGWRLSMIVEHDGRELDGLQVARRELRLAGVAAQYRALAQQAAEKHTLFTDFVEELLIAERESRRARASEMFARVAGFPAIKTLDQYDFCFATGAPRKQSWSWRVSPSSSALRTSCSSDLPIQRHNARLAM
jgi:hypothetical protein